MILEEFRLMRLEFKLICLEHNIRKLSKPLDKA